MDTPLGSVLYITLGCAKNEVDTDRMRSLLTAAGYEEAFDPQDADIAIVNTCSFLASATSESIETTLELANEVQDGVRSCPIVMCGCVPSRYGDDLPDELPEVAAFVKADEEDGIVAVIDGVLGVEREIAAYIPQVKRTVEGAVAYVKISDGCNRFCSFCMIPYIRGRYHSRNAESIISEVRDLVAGGVREIVLIGQDTGIWGTDFADEDVTDGSPRNLAQLLHAVAESVRPHNVWVRVLYLQPEGMTDELIDTIRDTPEVLPYIDIPVQHCDARILKAMRRSGSRQELEDLFRDLRERIPGIVIRSTAMSASRPRPTTSSATLSTLWTPSALTTRASLPTRRRRAAWPLRWRVRSMRRSSSSAPRRPWTWPSRSVLPPPPHMWASAPR